MCFERWCNALDVRLSVLEKGHIVSWPLYIRQMHPNTLANNSRTNTLPRDYERMMQKIMFRIGPTTLVTKKIKPMLMSKRETKFSEEARLSTPQGREIMYRRLLSGKRNLVPFGK
ncbi:hypothetical protein EGR_00521 [Echinococcus granulosus]|uniref:Uncharacterized protein n=1 Tax=Echinococcus granulosus TaxID=6210 RepID=W6UVC4_ECHGR|nr:hypothetical protein EGR_00521 [Echinococcus granulosus]EUB64571.1 hypothetical protein EGR_00521 [Echinococcus granulosus]